MSTGILYHGFGVRGYVHESTLYVSGEVVFWIRQEPESWRCSACGSPQVIGRGKEVRRFRFPPIGRQRVSLVLPVPPGGCHPRGGVRQGAVPPAPPRRLHPKPAWNHPPEPA